MRIVSLLGSPRKRGNSIKMARWITDAAGLAGAEISEYTLNDLTYKGCQGCWACKGKSEVCIVEDDLTPILAEVAACDALVLSTPVFYGDVSAQLKGFIDRTFSYLVPRYYRQPEKRSRLEPGKKLIMVIAQGAVDPERFDDIYPRYEKFLGWLGFTEARAFRNCGVYFLGDAAKHEGELKPQAEELARWLVE